MRVHVKLELANPSVGVCQRHLAETNLANRIKVKLDSELVSAVLYLPDQLTRLGLSVAQKVPLVLLLLLFRQRAGKPGPGPNADS